MQLEIKEYAVAGADELLGEHQPTRKCELVSDLVETNTVAQTLDHSFSVGNRWHVKRNNEALARRDSKHACKALKNQVGRALLPDI
jgi:hypothetical protein